jgi:DNA-binding NtrC family response regulator
MHRAVLLADGDTITAAAIELDSVPGGPPAGAHPFKVTSLVGSRVEDVERALILQTLSHCLGNRTHAATILGISIRTLRNKLREYQASGLDVPRPQAGIAA